MNDKDGGPAFARPSGEYNYDAEGMSLRDWYAGMALQGRLAYNAIHGGEVGVTEDMAVACFEYADEMIKERAIIKERDND